MVNPARIAQNAPVQAGDDPFERRLDRNRTPVVPEHPDRFALLHQCARGYRKLNRAGLPKELLGEVIQADFRLYPADPYPCPGMVWGIKSVG
jgi:hypothetical protein